MFVLNYLAVPATEFDRLAADDDQVDAVHELLESAEYPKIGKHTSELQSPANLVCRLLLEKKK